MVKVLLYVPALKREKPPEQYQKQGLKTVVKIFSRKLALL